MEQKAIRDEQQRLAFKNQQKYISEQERLINRFKAKASKASMAQSRIKMLERLERIDDVEGEGGNIKFKFSFAKTSGKIIADIKIDSKKYGDNEVIKDSQLIIERGDKIAMIGANGKGKSTLLRIINGSEPFEGKYQPGYNVIQAFYAQHQLESLNLDATLLEELQHAAPDRTDVELRTLLGAFLFEGDDVFKKIKVLSGGEKSRIALAKTILTQANFLLLDEPTNHLDMKSVNMLISVMKKFEGSFIVVSHDRFFLSQIANKIWYIDNRELKSYPGTYDEYLYWTESEARKAEQAQAAEVKAQAEKTIKTIKPSADKEKKKEAQKLNNQLKKIEESLNVLKMQKEQLLQQMALPENVSHEGKMKLLNMQFRQMELELIEANSEWENCYLKVMEAEA